MISALLITGLSLLTVFAVGTIGLSICMTTADTGYVGKHRC